MAAPCCRNCGRAYENPQIEMKLRICRMCILTGVVAFTLLTSMLLYHVQSETFKKCSKK